MQAIFRNIEQQIVDQLLKEEENNCSEINAKKRKVQVKKPLIAAVEKRIDEINKKKK